ncbi:MAG TPA: IS110 family transposase [Chthonomonadaceae bacterium]|nr:IS110 family transposase [Chthonomonadaceae bacterium]
MTQNALAHAWVGIDVSKEKLDACLLRDNDKTTSLLVDNSAKGFSKLLAWVKRNAPEAQLHFALEATGAYSNAVAEYLVEAQEKVSVVNPALIRHAGIAYGFHNRTDKTAAVVIALFCKKEKPALWRMARPEVRLLVALVRRREMLRDQRIQEHNRLSNPGLPKEIIQSLNKHIRYLDKEIAHLEERITMHIQNTPALQADKELLLSIPGIGETTAHFLLAELPEVSEFEEASAVAAYAGLAPCERSSGSSIKGKTHLSKRGKAELRHGLYMPAVAAIQCNPLVKALYDRLRERGHTRMSALGAAMRKLLMLAYGVLKNGQDFDPKWQEKSKQPAPAAT